MKEKETTLFNVYIQAKNVFEGFVPCCYEYPLTALLTEVVARVQWARELFWILQAEKA